MYRLRGMGSTVPAGQKDCGCGGTVPTGGTCPGPLDPATGLTVGCKSWAEMSSDITDGPMPVCPAGTLGTASSLFFQGVKEGFSLWASNPIAAVVGGVSSFGVPQGIQHLSNGTTCQPPSMGQDAVITGLGRAVVTVGPVLALGYFLFFRRGGGSPRRYGR